MGPFGIGKDPDESTIYRSSWYEDFSYFAKSDGSWLVRGGGWYRGSASGIFAFGNHTGVNINSHSYRIVLTP